MMLPVYRIVCEGCHREFDWIPNNINEQPPNYHNRACQKRRRERLNERFPTKCPHPWKRVYQTHKQAQDAINSMQDAYMKPYRCKCGGIHIGHVRMYIKDWVEK
jgi:hypothetical protein